MRCLPVFRLRPAATRGSSRLSDTASCPHGPGCSTRSQLRTRDAVPIRDSFSARETEEQRVSDTAALLEHTLPDEPADQNEARSLVQPGLEFADAHLRPPQQLGHRFPEPGRHGQPSVAQWERQLRPVEADTSRCSGAPLHDRGIVHGAGREGLLEHPTKDGSAVRPEPVGDLTDDLNRVESLDPTPQLRKLQPRLLFDVCRRLREPGGQCVPHEHFARGDLHRSFGDVHPRVGEDADRHVRGFALGGLGGMQETPRDVEAISRFQLDVDGWHAGVGVPTLATLMSERLLYRATPYLPVLHARYLQDENIVCVVVDVEPAGRWGCHVDVGLDGMSEGDLQLSAEDRDGGPVAMNGLKDDGCPLVEQCDHPSGLDEVVDRPRLQAAGLRVSLRRQRLAVAYPAYSREAQAMPGEYRVDVPECEEVLEPVGPRSCAQERPAPPP